MTKSIWLDPALIEFKITPVGGLKGVVGGDWDIDRRRHLTETVKYRSVVEHYANGARWQDTELFSDIYARRLSSGEVLRRATTLDGLVEAYKRQVDAIFESMARDGFKPIGSPPKFFVGRHGDVFIGNQGNHRLAMAHVLGLKSFAGEVVCKHP